MYEDKTLVCKECGNEFVFTAVCANCGKEAKVPFRPREDRPVYCSECFAKMKEEQ